MSAAITPRLLQLVEPACQAQGYDLCELRFVLEQGGWVLRVAIDLPLPTDPAAAGTVADPAAPPGARVSLDDCATMSHALSTVLDAADPIAQNYSLEVSSPGIDRPLRTPGHFTYFTGSEAKLQLRPGHGLATPSGERKNFRGVLAGVVDNARVAIDVDGQRFEVPIADLEHANLVPDWDAVMHGRSGIGPGGKPGPKAKPGPKPGQKPGKKAGKPGPRSPGGDGSADPGGAA
jgi:ribosome maturation factor RimP